MPILSNAVSIQVVPREGANAYGEFCRHVDAKGGSYRWITKGSRIEHHKTNRYTGHIDVSEGAGGILLALVNSDKPDIATGDFVSRVFAWLHEEIVAVNSQPHW